VLNREFIFSNPKVIKWLNENCVAVVGDNWYRRRAKDEASAWFRSVGKQAGRGKNGSTQQGSYLVTPQGSLLAFINSSDPDRFLAMMLKGTKKWKELDKAKGSIPDMKDPDYKVNIRPLDPAKGIVIEVQSRALTEKGGKITKWDSKGKVGADAALGHLWIQQSEWTDFSNKMSQLKVGQKLPFPKRITTRIARFHLADNTRGEGPAWKNDEVKTAEIYLTKAAKGYQVVGSFKLETKNKSRTFSGSLQGVLELEKGSAVRPKSWQMTVYGKHSGEGKYTKNARPGAQPLAFSFEFLSDPKSLDLVPPQHMRWQKGYWEAEKH
jgi:hypothetical protein